MATAWSGHHQYGGIPLEIPTIRESVAEEPVEQEAEEEELLPLELEEPTLRPEDISLPRRHAALLLPVPTPSTELPSAELLSSTESIPFPSPIPPSESSSHLSISLSTLTSPTEFSVMPTPSSMLAPTVPLHSPSLTPTPANAPLSPGVPSPTPISPEPPLILSHTPCPPLSPFDRAISPFYSSLSITGPNESGVAAWNTPAAFAFTAVR
ncbi:hypothetical protein BKA93DRAFT_830870 [Sparassis latifolia]